MSNLYKKYLSLKIEDSNSFYLFENGLFYIFISEDAKLMSKVLNLKLVSLNSLVEKCGFPASHLDKYLSRLSGLEYNVKIVTSSSFLAYKQKDYFTNTKAKQLLKKISNITSDELSISQAYELIDDISQEARSIIKEIEQQN